MRAARQIKRRIDETARTINQHDVPESLACLAGDCGPYIAADRAEFRHACKEAQEWYIRLDAQEVEDLKYSIALGRFVRGFIKWTVRGVAAFSTALATIYAFGEKLAKLPETMHGALSGVSEAIAILRGWFGL